VWKPEKYAPKAEAARDKAWVDGQEAEDLSDMEDEFKDDRFMEGYRLVMLALTHGYARAHGNTRAHLRMHSHSHGHTHAQANTQTHICTNVHTQNAGSAASRS